MAPVIFIVHTSIDPAKEDEFNDWYNNKHQRDILKFSGAVAARRYRKVAGEGQQYIAIYEFPSQEKLEAWRASPERDMVWAEHLELFGPFPDPDMAAYEQIWP